MYVADDQTQKQVLKPSRASLGFLFFLPSCFMPAVPIIQLQWWTIKIQETISVISTQLQTQGEVAKQYIGVKSVHHEAYLHKQQESQVMKILHEVLPKDNMAAFDEGYKTVR